jgi:hypothetical protein
MNTEADEEQYQLLEIRKSDFLAPVEGEKMKLGRYMQGAYRTPEFGDKQWVVGCHIKAPIDEKLKLGFTLMDIVEEACEFFNTPTGRKKKTKFGNLKPLPYSWSIKRIKQDVLSVEVTTDQEKNANFWF